MGRALPSKAARDLLDTRLRATDRSTRSDTRSDSAIAESTPGGVARVAVDRAQAPDESVLAAGESAPVRGESVQAGQSAPKSDDPALTKRELPSGATRSSAIADPDAHGADATPVWNANAPIEISVRPAPRIRTPKMPAAEARALFAELEYDIEGALDEAGLLEPERLRLLILSWIARARAVESQAASPEAYEFTHAIARRLSRLAKIWWPGSVRALGIHGLPSECATEIPGGAGLELATWSDVATAAERALDEHEDLDADRLDAHGWADAAALEPAHPRPDVELSEVVAQIERFTNPIVRPSETEDGVPAFSAGQDPSTLDVTLLATAARKLRWLRGATSDLELWGAAVGRLRWASAVLRARGDPIARALDPRYVPVGSWAQELRYDPDKKRRQKTRKALISAAGAPKPGWGDPELRDWLRQALELGDMLPSERIAQVLEEQGVVESVLRIGAPTFSDRRTHRTRLEAIQRHLRGDQALVTSAPTPSPVDEDDDGAGASYFDRMLEPILAFTRGKHVLFVSNRNDPTIDAKLRELFAFEEVDHCEVKSSNASAKAKRVEQGSYDMVLAATGFLSHSTDSIFREAARRALIPHVRVNKGRPLSVALALARELGIRVPTGSAGSST